MKYRILYINFSQFRIHPLSKLFSYHFAAVSLIKRVSELTYACCLYVLWKFKHRFEYSSLCLQKLRFLVPVTRNRHSVLKCLKLAQKKWIRCCDIPRLYQIRSFDSRLELCDLQPPQFFSLRNRQFHLFFLVALPISFSLLIFIILLILARLIIFLSFFLMPLENTFQIIKILACEHILTLLYNILSISYRKIIFLISLLFFIYFLQIQSYGLFLFEKLLLIYFLSLFLLSSFFVYRLDLCLRQWFFTHTLIIIYKRRFMNQPLTAQQQHLGLIIQGRLRNLALHKVLRIFIFEAIGTCILTYAAMTSQFLPPIPPFQPYLPNPTQNIFITAVYFVCMCLIGPLTGGHCNPLVTIALLVVKDNKINLVVCIIYVVSQFIGALIGGAIAYGLYPNFNFQLQADSTSPLFVQYQLRIAFAQICGAFMFALFVLIQFNETTSNFKAIFWNYVFIPISFFIIRQATYEFYALNPACVLSYQLFTGILNDNWQPLSQYYLYSVAPVLGALLCGVFYDFYYLPLFVRWKTPKK